MKQISAVELGDHKAKISSSPRSSSGVKKGLSILDFVLRLVAIVGTLASAATMATTYETLPFFTRFIRFRAKYDDLPTFTFFVLANAIVSGYLVLSLVPSIFHIMRSNAQKSRILLIIFDAVMLAVLTAAASASAAVVLLAHNGNTNTNWFAICRQFNSFCERLSGSLIGSFVGVGVFLLVILLSGVALSRR